MQWYKLSFTTFTCLYLVALSLILFIADSYEIDRFEDDLAHYSMVECRIWCHFDTLVCISLQSAGVSFFVTRAVSNSTVLICTVENEHHMLGQILDQSWWHQWFHGSREAQTPSTCMDSFLLSEVWLESFVEAFPLNQLFQPHLPFVSVAPDLIPLEISANSFTWRSSDDTTRVDSWCPLPLVLFYPMWPFGLLYKFYVSKEMLLAITFILIVHKSLFSCSAWTWWHLQEK